MAEAHMFPDHRSVLCFHKAVIVGAPETRLRLLYQKLVQQFGDCVVDELAAVI